ncbi:MAG: ABC transporter permease [Bacteroidales bacterium]
MRGISSCLFLNGGRTISTVFDYRFTDEYLEIAYTNELKFRQIFMVFAVLSTLIAALGLFGLAAFEAEKRKKEIGIRKILGSSVTEIASFLVYRFLKWVLLGNIIAWPIAYLFMKNWLNNFSFKVSVNPLLFLIATLISILIAVITVWSRSYHIANMNPAESIKYE